MGPRVGGWGSPAAFRLSLLKRRYNLLSGVVYLNNSEFLVISLMSITVWYLWCLCKTCSLSVMPLLLFFLWLTLSYSSNSNLSIIYSSPIPLYSLLLDIAMIKCLSYLFLMSLCYLYDLQIYVLPQHVNPKTRQSNMFHFSFCF